MTPTRTVSERVFVAVNRIASRIAISAGGRIERRADGNYAVRPGTSAVFISSDYIAEIGTDSERHYYSVATDLQPSTFAPSILRAEWKAYLREIAANPPAVRVFEFRDRATWRPVRVTIEGVTP
jgi:hypothetical protein